MASGKIGIPDDPKHIYRRNQADICGLGTQNRDRIALGEKNGLAR